MSKWLLTASMLELMDGYAEVNLEQQLTPPFFASIHLGTGVNGSYGQSGFGAGLRARVPNATGPIHYGVGGRLHYRYLYDRESELNLGVGHILIPRAFVYSSYSFEIGFAIDVQLGWEAELGWIREASTQFSGRKHITTNLGWRF